MNKIKYALLIIICCWSVLSFSQSSNYIAGAERTSQYISLLKKKNVAVVANPTSMIGDKHLVDSLVNQKIKIKCVFAPEHGFRGNAEAGEHLDNGLDKKSGVKVISLYGKHFKPTREDLHGVHLVLFDIQDVGVRFYTYISTLQYVMESCIENKIPLIVLDRPNPNGFYIDGPVLDTAFKSFVGMQPIPVVHGMTIGEYALFLNGEYFKSRNKQCDLKVIAVENWNHKSHVVLPIPPSPNLPNMPSIYLYPSLCLFEGTKISVGRGTDKPFQIFGYPESKNGDYYFTPVSIPGKAKSPMYENQLCKGFDVTEYGQKFASTSGQLNLNWIIQLYEEANNKNDFFNSFFDKLAGSDLLKKQIETGFSEDEIRNSWGEKIESFKSIRKKYLLYEDF
ncbi:MAG: exo-beta-N-acetylmuramidase NamZ domain-containing protein [Bacteroidota bacterium]